MVKKVKKEATKKPENKQDLDLGIPTLSNEQRLELMVSNLTRENIKGTITAEHNRSEFLERERLLCKLKISDFKARLTAHDKKHKSMIEEFGRKLGVMIDDDSAIDPITGQITRFK